DKLFEMIRIAPPPTPTPTTTNAPRVAPATPRVAPATPTTTTGTATAKELQDIKALCCCLPISQLDNYAT
ncbi:MAG: hypothetical protein ACKPKO_38780, partial [Candidatus Fonsibacter sp.]